MVLVSETEIAEIECHYPGEEDILWQVEIKMDG